MTDLTKNYYHPKILQAIDKIIKAGNKAGIPVDVCGEMASEKKYVKLLLALGVDELSVSPGRLLIIKKEILDCDIAKMKLKLDKILSCKTSKDVLKLI